MLANKLMSALSGGAEEKLYVDDVFSTYLYTGNGSTQTINNGIDLAGKGGLVWIKRRDSGFAGNHELQDTVKGIGNCLQTNTTNANLALNRITVSSSGFNLLNNSSNTNASGGSFVGFTFRRSPKFFDVVTYTGNGVAGRQIPHLLGIAPGMLFVKRTNSTQNWWAYHRSAGSDKYLFLNTSSAADTDLAVWSNTNPTDTEFTVSNYTGLNEAGSTYVAYLFAHDSSADGIIQCGSFTTDASGNATVNLGWEPQYLMVKASSASGNWEVADTSRGQTAGPSGSANSLTLFPNLSNAEAQQAPNCVMLSATGFSVNSYRVASATFIYLAIRRPNKPPTTGTQVYNAIARTGTGAATTVTGVGFAPDLVKVGGRNLPSGNVWFDRLRGAKTYLSSQSTYQETTNSNSVLSYDMGGCTFGADTAGDVNLSGGYNYINHFFRRAPGFFDVVCTNDNGSNQTLNHSLGVAPELIIEKQRSSGTDWWVQLHAINAMAKLNLTDAAFGNLSAFPVTATTFKTAGYSSGTSVAYLFASVPGISKVGSYTGNGSSQTINCGFTTGARFVLIKKTSGTGDWLVWDTARGIVSANDPHLSLNTTATEVTTDDSVDPANSGFIVNQVAATNINVTGGTYIFLAIS